MKPTYDILRTWDENCERGPQLDSQVPELTTDRKKPLLGYWVNSRLGIAAGLLPNSRWLLPYAQRGFDILTYKTVRSVERPCYPLPNWVFVEDDGNLDGPVYALDRMPTDPEQISSAVCFGMPSVAPEVWRDDVRIARDGLTEGQLLIVSVVATPSDRPSLEEIAEDYARCARWAVESGAHVIEANLSCPNVCSAEGTLYHDADASAKIARWIREAIGTIPLLLKIGAFQSAVQMESFLRAVAEDASGVTLVNCLSRPVLHRDGRPVFGPNFLRVGVLGRAIHEPSVAMVRDVVQCIQRNGLALQTLAVGGVSTESDVGDFFAAGADAVLCGSAPMYLPDLAIQLRQRHPEW